VSDTSNRRPLKSRSSGWARLLARGLAKAGVSPDMISFFSLAFALLGAGALAVSSQSFGGWRIGALVLAVLCIQLRLLCNLLDGMVAVEHGKGSPYGPIWNELPDRIADVVLLVGAGVGAMRAGAIAGPVLGCACAILAVMTAYVRELGRGLGFDADFSGPMAKPHRMGLLTAAAVVSTTEQLWLGQGETFLWALALMAALTMLTVIRRTFNLGRALRKQARAEGRLPPA
jgi:phosphatidylglycerophosphate synthase